HGFGLSGKDPGRRPGYLDIVAPCAKNSGLTLICLGLFANRARFGLQPALDRGEHKFADVAAQNSDLANNGARDELILVRGRHEQCFDFGKQMAIHARHLELVLEVGHGAQTAHDDAPILVTHEILEQTAEAFHFDVRVMAEHLARDLDPFFNGEEWPLVGAVRDADDDMIEQPRSATHQVFMAARERIESTWIDSSYHAFLTVESGLAGGWQGTQAFNRIV